MKDKRGAIYVIYKGQECEIDKFGCVQDDIPEQIYLFVDEKKDLYDDMCFKWLSRVLRPIEGVKEFLGKIYEIRHYVVCNGRKYKHFDYFPEEKGLWVYAADWGSNTEVDPKYEVVESGRDGIYIEVPYDEVTLYETKTYYDKEKFINENKRVVLSEETYLIDEPWWLEETKDN